VDLSIVSNLFHRPLPKFCVITIHNDETNANLVHYINQNLEDENPDSLTTVYFGTSILSHRPIIQE
jgi:hypothetical protein